MPVRGEEARARRVAAEACAADAAQTSVDGRGGGLALLQTGAAAHGVLMQVREGPTATTTPVPAEQADAEACAALPHFLANLGSSLGEERAARLHNAAHGLPRHHTVYAYMSTRHILCMLDSTWMQAVDSLAGRAVIHIALDNASHAYCGSRLDWAAAGNITLRCVDLSDWIPYVDESGPKGIEDNNVGFGTCEYLMIVWAKPVVLLQLSAVVDTLLVDSDILLRQSREGSLIDWAEHHRKSSTVLMTESEYPNWIETSPNTGAVLATDESSDLIEAWIAQAPDSRANDTGDQDGLLRLLVQEPQMVDEVQFIPFNVLAAYAIPGQYGSHYTKVDKVATMKERGDWKPSLRGCDDG